MIFHIHQWFQNDGKYILLVAGILIAGLSVPAIHYFDNKHQETINEEEVLQKSTSEAGPPNEDVVAQSQQECETEANNELEQDWSTSAEAYIQKITESDDEDAIRRAILSPPAPKEEILKALSFLPDVVAEVNGTMITKSQIVDLLLSKKLSSQVLALTPESYLRNVMQKYVDQKIDTEILLQKAKEAGFEPSEEVVKTHFDYSINKLPTEQAEAVKAQIKERGISPEVYRDEIAKETNIQCNAAIAAYEEKFFVAKAEKAVTDEDIEKYYRENLQEYAVPENITVAHILIQCAPINELDSTEEREIKVREEKFAKEQIYNIYAELVKNPSSFDKLAQEKSECPSGKRDNGKLPAFDKEGHLLDKSGMLDPDFASASFKLKKVDAFSKPVRTQFGYHIIKLVKQNPKGYMPLENVKGEIHDFLVDKTVAEEIQAMIKAERARGDIKVYSFTLTMAASLLKSMPERTAMTCEMLSPKASPEYPLMGELKRITLHVVRDEMDKRPVHADIVMPAKSTEAAQIIQKSCQDSIEKVYSEAAKLGKIPEELVNAFTVTRNNADVSIHIALPDDMAKYLFTQFAVALQEEVNPFAIPDKLK